MRASPLVLGGRQRNKMQHPLTGATCVALPNVGMCPQLSCALTFMYLQQVRRALPFGGCSPGSRTQSPCRRAALRYLGGVWEGAGAFGQAGCIGAPHFPWAPDTPCPAVCAPLCILGKLFPTLGNRSWNCKLPSPYSHLSGARASVVTWVSPSDAKSLHLSEGIWCLEFQFSDFNREWKNICVCVCARYFCFLKFV